MYVKVFICSTLEGGCSQRQGPHRVISNRLHYYCDRWHNMAGVYIQRSLGLRHGKWKAWGEDDFSTGLGTEVWLRCVFPYCDKIHNKGIYFGSWFERIQSLMVRKAYWLGYEIVGGICSQETANPESLHLAAFILSFCIHCGSPGHVTVPHIKLKLTDTFRCVSPQGFWIQSNWQWRQTITWSPKSQILFLPHSLVSGLQNLGRTFL